MNEQDKTNTQALGKTLQDARLSASLTAEEVALKLNLAISTVRDMEDNLENLIESQQIPDIYLRGYIANYAKLVNLKKLDQFSVYQQLCATQMSAQNMRPPLKVSAPKRRGKRLLILLILLAIIGVACFAVQQFFFNGKRPAVSERNLIHLESDIIPVEQSQAIVIKRKVVNTDEAEP